MPLLRYDRLEGEDVKRGSESKAAGILPVPRTREEARQAYNSISRYYGYTAGALGRKYSEMALQRLSIAEGETVLEIGFGTGYCLKLMADLVGRGRKVCGIDISSSMIQKTKTRLEKAGLTRRAELCCADATCLPFDDNSFDAVLMSFVLEVMDTPEIPRVLEETKRVLKPGGRLGVASMSKENGESIFLKVYEWIHNRWPKYVGSRPIYAGQALIDAGFQVKSKEKVRILRLPAEIIVAVKAVSGNTV